MFRLLNAANVSSGEAYGFGEGGSFGLEGLAFEVSLRTKVVRIEGWRASDLGSGGC